MKEILIKSTYSIHKVLVDAGKSISVQRIPVNSEEPASEPVYFKIGDIAEYDSWNLVYLGEIVSITEKTVTIQPKYENKKYRLKLEQFAWRNYDFDLERINKENFETRMYI